MENKSLIEFTAFKKKNGLKQQDISDYLGVSRSYISMVECGSSKLSRDNINKLFAAGLTMGWDVDGLVPGYSRLLQALNYMDEHMDDSGSVKPYNVPDNILMKIKYGEMEIPSFVADGIISVCPEIRKAWLLFGDGEMTQQIGYEPTLNEVIIRLEKLEDSVLACLRLLWEIKEKKC